MKGPLLASSNSWSFFVVNDLNSQPTIAPSADSIQRHQKNPSDNSLAGETLADHPRISVLARLQASRLS